MVKQGNGKVLGSFGYSVDHEKTLTTAGFDINNLLKWLQKFGSLAKAIIDAILLISGGNTPAPNPALKAAHDACPCPDPSDGGCCCQSAIHHAALGIAAGSKHCCCQDGTCDDTDCCCREMACHLLKALECCACHCCQ